MENEGIKPGQVRVQQMTPQERAAAIVDKVKSELTPIWLGGRQRMLLKREIAEALQATRRAALLECLEETLKPEYYHAYNGVSALHEWLKDRLAQEGS